TYRSVFILLGRAALRADQHVHLLFPPVMRVQCANRTDSSTQHQRYHLLSAATLNNSRNRNFVHQKDHLRLAAADLLGHVFACLLWIVVIRLLWAWGIPSSAPSCLPQRPAIGSL